MAYELRLLWHTNHPLLCHMNCFYWGWSLICWRVLFCEIAVVLRSNAARQKHYGDETMLLTMMLGSWLQFWKGCGSDGHSSCKIPVSWRISIAGKMSTLKHFHVKGTCNLIWWAVWGFQDGMKQQETRRNKGTKKKKLRKKRRKIPEKRPWLVSFSSGHF